MRSVVRTVALVLIATTTAAQDVEVGGTIAAGCLGSDGSACGNGTHPMFGAHASWWVSDRMELSGRFARVDQPSYRSRTVFPVPLDFEVTDRSRQFLSAMFVYHFRRGKAVRPMLGFGSGRIGTARRVTCEPAGCGDGPGRPLEGFQRSWMTDAILMAGLSGQFAERWVWRGGWLSHRFANDENSTIEYFVGVGYRFGGR